MWLAIAAGAFLVNFLTPISPVAALALAAGNVAGRPSARGWWPAWLVWWLGDALGMLVVAPLALTVVTQRRVTQLRYVPELVALVTAVVVTCFAIFDSRIGLDIERDVFAFAVLPLVVWGAIRFEIPGAAGVTLLIAGMASGDTSLRGHIDQPVESHAHSGHVQFSSSAFSYKGLEYEVLGAPAEASDGGTAPKPSASAHDAG